MHVENVHGFDPSIPRQKQRQTLHAICCMLLAVGATHCGNSLGPAGDPGLPQDARSSDAAPPSDTAVQHLDGDSPDAMAPPDVAFDPDAMATDAEPDALDRDARVSDGDDSDATAADAGADVVMSDTMRADPPALPAYSHGACPMLTGGSTPATSVNTGFRTGSQRRDFRLLVPRGYDGSREVPVVFLWHWLNASSGSFVRDGELESAVDQMGFIAVLPDALRNDRGDRVYQFNWPFVEFWGQDSEMTFFDDLLACVAGQYRIDRRRVHGVGVSAGGLWLTFLSTTRRANYFASIESLSGGLGEVPFAWRMEYAAQPNKFPALVLWGGASDWLVVDFNRASLRYRDALRADAHFVVTCTHSSGHALPPIPAPADGSTRFRSLWQFLLDHPYGLAPGASPYRTTGLPSVFPSWCRIAP